MNRDNINKVIDWLERGAPEVVFSMQYSLRDIGDTGLEDDEYDDLPLTEQDKVDNGCGSVCCIAGAAAQFDGAKPNDYDDWSPVQDRALKYFGIPRPENCPWMLAVFDPDRAPMHCTPQQAAKALALWADNVHLNINFNPWEHIE